MQGDVLEDQVQSTVYFFFFEKAYLNIKLLTEVSTRRDLLETIGAGA